MNSAGLHAPAVASRIEGMKPEAVPRSYYAVGHYDVLARKSPFTRLVYPLAEKGGLGIHVTIDIKGAVRFGPDVRWRESPDYSFDDSQRQNFIDVIRSYNPAMEARWLNPGYTDIRPKVSGPENPSHDFIIQAAQAHQVKGLINLFGIESPGLITSCTGRNGGFDRKRAILAGLKLRSNAFHQRGRDEHI